MASSITTSTPASAEVEAGEVRSADGTCIGYLRLGSGRGLVISHGSLTIGEDWLPVAGRLADRFACFVISRRGHGRSGAGRSQSLERECEDIAAVLALAGPGAHLLGHSYGAICALETAVRTPVGKLVLYEPPLSVDYHTVNSDDLAAYRSAIEAGRLEEALAGGFRRFIRMHETQLEELMKTPLWPEMVKLAPTWVPELAAISGLEPGVDRYRSLSNPTLLLVGADTQPHHITASEALQRALPNVRTVTLQGQGHEAHVTVPDSVAAAIAEFLA